MGGTKSNDWGGNRPSSAIVPSPFRRTAASTSATRRMGGCCAPMRLKPKAPEDQGARRETHDREKESCYHCCDYWSYLFLIIILIPIITIMIVILAPLRGQTSGPKLAEIGHISSKSANIWSNTTQTRSRWSKVGQQTLGKSWPTCGNKWSITSRSRSRKNKVGQIGPKLKSGQNRNNLDRSRSNLAHN